MVEGLSPDARDALGKTARTKGPRRNHGTWEPSSARPDPIDLLEQQAATRVAELVPIRYGRMLASPFAFFRGAALIMASDLASTPRSGFQVQLCGDAHLSNFGVFGTPERRLCSMSTTLTRPARARGSGMSSGLRQASWLRVASAAFRR